MAARRQPRTASAIAENITLNFNGAKCFPSLSPLGIGAFDPLDAQRATERQFFTKGKGDGQRCRESKILKAHDLPASGRELNGMETHRPRSLRLTTMNPCLSG